MNKQKVIDVLNKALEHEMSSMVRYLHHSFMVSGPQRGALQTFFRSLVKESNNHAIAMGEKITALGGHPSVKIAEIYEPGVQTIHEMLKEDLAEEERHMAIYENLLTEVEDDVPLKVFLEDFVFQEQKHIDELTLYVKDSG
jgi:bacterioferritin